jgi:hypothetical protein
MTAHHAIQTLNSWRFDTDEVYISEKKEAIDKGKKQTFETNPGLG